MHGLICKSLEGFVIDRHGSQVWTAIREECGLPFDRFEALRSYDDALIVQVVGATAKRMGQPRLALLEDIGHWICTHPPLEAVRRLIRFTGATFVDLIYAFDEVQDRARIAVPGLTLPRFRVIEGAPGHFTVTSHWDVAGGGAVATGILRAMADDYGALAVIETVEAGPDDGAWRERIDVRLFEVEFHEPREFSLGGGAVP